MSLSRSDVQELYTRSIDRYASFIGAFQSPQAMQALLQRSNLLHSGLRVLDAGCGFGMVTFALLKALREKNLDYERSMHSTSLRQCWRVFRASCKSAASPECNFSKPMC